MKYFEVYEKYKRSIYFFYSNENKDDGFSFCKGIDIKTEKELIYNVEKIDDYINKYDFLPVSSGPPLVSKRFRDCFSELEEKLELKYYKSKIIDEEGVENNDFLVLNILSSRIGLDKENSITEVNKYGIFKIKKLALLSDFMDDLIMTRLEEKKSIIIVSEIFKEIFKKNKLKGVDFVSC